MWDRTSGYDDFERFNWAGGVSMKLGLWSLGVLEQTVQSLEYFE